jgi:Protein of unknown function (DUF3015)
MRFRYLCLFVGLSVVSSTALAQEEENTPEEPAAAAPAAAPAPAAAAAKSGYGNAGCGLGSLLFEPSNGFSQVFAATTNGTGTQTFGISSGTSHCDGAGYQPGSAAAYIQTNRAALAKDIARGKGATLAGLSELAGCKDSRAVGKKLRRQFKTIFTGPSVGDQQVSDTMIRVMKSDSSLMCQNLG